MTKIHDLMQNFFPANFPFAEPEKNQNAKKFRNEHKYVSPEFILQEIQARLDAILPRDEHSVVGRGGGVVTQSGAFTSTIITTPASAKTKTAPTRAKNSA